MQGANEAFGNTQMLWDAMDRVFTANASIRQETIEFARRDEPQLSRQDARMP